MNGIMLQRRQVLLLGALALTGCAGSRFARTERYTEEVSTLLLAEDGSQLAIFGPTYHYLFNAPQALITTLQADLRQYVSAQIGEFRVRDASRVSGAVWLLLDSAAPDWAVEQATRAGYQRNRMPDGSNPYGIRLQLDGRRYLANGMDPSLGREELRQTYQVQVVEERWGAKEVGKVVVTPFVLTAQGVVFLLGLPFAIIGAVVGVAVMLAVCGTDGCFVGGGGP